MYFCVLQILFFKVELASHIVDHKCIGCYAGFGHIFLLQEPAFEKNLYNFTMKNCSDIIETADPLNSLVTGLVKGSETFAFLRKYIAF